MFEGMTKIEFRQSFQSCWQSIRSKSFLLDSTSICLVLLPNVTVKIRINHYKLQGFISRKCLLCAESFCVCAGAKTEIQIINANKFTKLIKRQFTGQRTNNEMPKTHIKRKSDAIHEKTTSTIIHITL